MKQGNNKPTPRNIVAKLECEMAEDSLKILVGSSEGYKGQVMLIPAEQLAGTKEVQKHRKINAF